MSDKPIVPEGGLFSMNKNKPASAANSASAHASNNIKITKKKFKEGRTQVGWRLNSSTVEKIQELAYLSRMGINEFVQELLDKALNDIDIE
jgi:hypothetical protein